MNSMARDRTIEALRFSFGDTKLGLALVALSDRGVAAILLGDDRLRLSLAKRLADPRTRWRRLQVSGWYGRGERLVEIVSGTALWHHPGSLVPIRYVLVRDAAGELRRQAFLCTDLDADRSEIRRICAWSTSCAGSSAVGRSR